MRRPEKILTCNSVLLLISLFVLLFPASEETELISYFQARSIPVFGIERLSETAVVKMRYKNLEDLDRIKLESDQLTILKKIGEEYPELKRIALEYYAGEVKILESEYKTAGVAQFIEGVLDKEGLLADASITIKEGAKELLSKDHPQDWNLGKKIEDPEGKYREKKLEARSGPSDQEMLEAARQFLIDKNYDIAIAQFRKTLPSLPLPSLQGLGLCYYYQKFYDDAFYYLARAYKEKPQSPLTIFYMAATLDHWGRGLEAAYCFEAYLKIDDSDEWRRKTAKERLFYLVRFLRRSGSSLYRSIDEVIYVILGDKIDR